MAETQTEPKGYLGWIFFAMLIIFLGIPFLNAIADVVKPQTSALTNINETLDISSAIYSGAGVYNETRNINESVGFNLTNVDVVSITVIRNSSNIALTAGTDYNLNNTAKNIYFKNTTAVILYDETGNTTYVTYSYHTTDYIKDSAASRTVIKLVILFFVLGIIAYIIYAMMKQYGLTGVSIT